MKKFLFVSLTIFSSLTGISQDLSFAEIGSEPAFCRLFSYQNGNGIVYASATGGTPDYSYQCEHLETGEVFPGGTWGGRNPGTYKFTVTDAAGDTFSETITLDSVNIIADFHVFSDDLSEIADGYIGFAPDTLGFINLSENFANPNNPVADSTCFWNFNPPTDEWIISHDFTSTIYKGFLYGGEFDVCLVTLNKNGCADSTCKTIGLFGSLAGVDDNEQNGVFTITPKANNNEIVITKGGLEGNLRMNIYSVSGQLIYREELINSTTNIPFYYDRGIYFYEFADKNGQIISSGKFNF
ncbi:MAG: T9SS type A sorting domain-containing protein [Crocinitomix sp.]|nr:T9SS type A sorting domain-containing protein [Crocinitomix sp.]